METATLTTAQRIRRRLDEIEEALGGFAADAQRRRSGVPISNPRSMGEITAHLPFTDQGQRDHEAKIETLLRKQRALQKQYEELPSHLKNGDDDA